MGKLEKFGRSILKKLGRNSQRRRAASNATSSGSSDEELAPSSRSMPDVHLYVHKFQLDPPDDDVAFGEGAEGTAHRTRSPAASEHDSAGGYSTDNSLLSSLSPLDVKRNSVDYSESQGYYSTAELSPVPRIMIGDEEEGGTVIQEQTSPRVMVPTVPQNKDITSPRITVPSTVSQNSDRTSPIATVIRDQNQHSPRITVPAVRTMDHRLTVSSSSPSTVPQDPTSPLNTVSRNQNQNSPRITVPSTVPQTKNPISHLQPTVLQTTVRTPLFTKKPSSQEYPRINVAPRLTKIHPLHKSTHLLTEPKEQEHRREQSSINGRRSATLSNLTDSDREEKVVDPIERFLKSSIYKTKMITTVFEAKNGGIEEIYEDVHHEIDRWFETKNMMAVACEMHWSVPTSKRSRQLECKLKEKLLIALRENNKRLLYLKGMGRGKTPVKLAESKTVENISRDKETDSVRGIYQRSYTRLLPYLHKETPEWHSQYWTLQDLQNPQDHGDGHQHEAPPTPQPQQFLFNDEPMELLITATNSDNDEKAQSASRLLKIHVENEDDNEPRFLQSANPVFEIPSNTSKPIAIGRLTAFDLDSNPIFYHILPKCGSKISNNFTIDPEFGEIIYHPDINHQNEPEPEPIELCFIATSQKEMDVSEVFFDGSARNMRKVIVYFTKAVDGNHKSEKNGLKNELRILGNQSISQIGDVLDRVEIPISLNEESSNVEFQLEDLHFVPANYELGRDVISPEGSVELNKKTGELVANGKILDTPQGVYTAKITRGQENRAVKRLHHIKNDRKLRYVLAMSRNEFGANSEKFKRQILEAVGEGKKLDVYFDEPVMDKKNSTWTSVCFYLTRDDAILDEKQMNTLISSSNGHIAKLHHIFKVVNVDSCAPRATLSSSNSSSAPSDIPLNTLILIGVVGLLIIALVALLVYVCCVSRYQRYLKHKTDRMKGNSSAGSYYKSPNLIPPPGYIHTPPLPPPPPPVAIGYY